METENARSTTKVEMTKSATAINISAHIALFTIAAAITYKAFEQGPSLFSWHPTLLVLGVSDHWISWFDAFDYGNLLFENQIASDQTMTCLRFSNNSTDKYICLEKIK